MSYFISTEPLQNVKIMPENTVEEIIQNIHTILSTPKGSVPMYRDFGLDFDVVDKNINAVKSLIVNAIYDAIEKYEPRASIVNITFDGDAMRGKIVPVVEVNILNE
ncbi:MAG: GPW/gp25 family protein [Clostridia bacterium]|nr:GPW/gp25 family protein [Clostridia bacterium]